MNDFEEDYMEEDEERVAERRYKERGLGLRGRIPSDSDYYQCAYQRKYRPEILRTDSNKDQNRGCGKGSGKGSQEKRAMSEEKLRKAVIRLAYEKPELRGPLLDLVRPPVKEAAEEEPEEKEEEAEEAKGEEKEEKEAGKKASGDNESLRKKVIRLAFEKANLRDSLLPLLGQGKEATTDSDLRKKLIRLAHETPAIRADVLPLVIG